MAITAANGVYLTAGPTASGQILAPNEQSNLRSAYRGTATFILDGSTLSATLNFIDGTKTLPFTPTAIVAQVVGGTQSAASPVGVTSTAVVSAATGTIYFSAAGTNLNTVIVEFEIVK